MRPPLGAGYRQAARMLLRKLRALAKFHSAKTNKAIIKITNMDNESSAANAILLAISSTVKPLQHKLNRVVVYE